MKRIIRKVRHLGQSATELREALAKLPPKVAEIRQAVAMTTGQFQQLRADVQSSVSDLRADNEDRLMTALQEINGSEEVFRQAGYELSGIDMELSPNQRLLVHLDKVDDVHQSNLRRLLAANEKRKTTHALLNALHQADQMAGQTRLTNLTYRELIVHVGPVPSVRLCWRTDDIYEDEPAEEIARTPTASPSASKSPFGPSSFFERRHTQVNAPSPAPTTVEQPSPPPLPGTTQAVSGKPAQPPLPAPTGDWKIDSLARFKQMPTASKYRQ